jgi:hypothetical protein
LEAAVRSSGSIVRWFSVAALLTAVALLFVELVAYSRQRASFPRDLQVAGVPVGGLTPEAAGQRLVQVYGAPLEMVYQASIFFISPSAMGFTLDLDTMLASADLYRTEGPFWPGFWAFLWKRAGPSYTVPLKAEYSQSQLRAVLADIAARYDQPGAPPQPIPGTTNFTGGTPGTVLNQAQAEERVANALRSPDQRKITLPLNSGRISAPPMNTLQIMIQQLLQVGDFDGLLDLYLLDLRQENELHMLTLAGQDLESTPDVAFSAASLAKIGIMVGVYRYLGSDLDPEAARWLEEMITLSGNDPSDWLMERIDEARGPLMVTDALHQLGLESTFLAGYYRPGSPVLRAYTTPANQRTDISTRPDVYIQTTPTDIGSLLADIYRCTQGGGTLRVVFPEQFSPEVCARMLDVLSRNKIGVLIEAGVPDGTRVAHKHGWTEESLGLGALSDAGVVFTPGGDYVLAVFLWKEGGMVWERDSRVVADISRAVYNYFNLPIE